MGRLYFIQNLKRFLPQLHKKNKDSSYPVPLSNFVIEINSKAQEENFIDAIARTDTFEDQGLKQYLELKLPQSLKYIKKTPFSKDNLHKALLHIFNDIPDSTLESSDTVLALQEILDSIIKKNSILFYTTHIRNGKLLYDAKYPYKKNYEFYFKMIKLNYDLVEYYSYFRNLQRYIEWVYLRDIYYQTSNSKFSRKEVRLFQEGHNVIAQNSAEFRFELQNLLDRVNKEMVFIKRSHNRFPKGYMNEEKKLVSTINAIISQLEKDLEKAHIRKKEIEEELKNRSFTKKVKDFADWVNLFNFKDFFNF